MLALPAPLSPEHSGSGTLRNGGVVKIYDNRPVGMFYLKNKIFVQF